jgi:selenocysteine-specific elongation factor
MLLIVDITKGFQPQTAECLLIGEITCKKMIVVLNKLDLIPEDKRKSTVEKMTKKVSTLLAKTSLNNSPIVAVSGHSEINLDKLIETLVDSVEIPQRASKNPFLFSFDHCFSIKGSGTVFTGTVLDGSLKINDEVEIPLIKETKKVKSMQMFKKSVAECSAGDRCGICLTQVDPSKLERGILCSKGLVKFLYCAVIKLNHIKYFKRTIQSKGKFHISVGHETVMTKILLFSSKSLKTFDFLEEFQYEDEFSDDPEQIKNYFALLEFEKPVLAPDKSLLIGSKLDEDLSLHTCRLAFHDQISYGFSSDDKNYSVSFLPRLKIFKNKQRAGTIQRFVNEQEVIAANLFKKETDRNIFLNLKVSLLSGESGYIESLFGQSSKVKIRIPDGLKKTTIEQLKNSKEPIVVNLNFKKYVFNKKNEILQ